MELFMACASRAAALHADARKIASRPARSQSSGALPQHLDPRAGGMRPRGLSADGTISVSVHAHAPPWKPDSFRLADHARSDLAQHSERNGDCRQALPAQLEYPP
jgi:hypothetical protein